MPVAGLSWLYVSQPDPDHAGQRRASELPASQQAIWSTTRKPGRCHLSSITVKMITAACNLTSTPDGEKDKAWGNETIRWHPGEGWLEIRLRAPLAHLANRPHGRYRLSWPVGPLGRQAYVLPCQ